MGRPKKIISAVNKTSLSTTFEEPINLLDTSSTEIDKIKQSCVKNGIGLDNYILAIKEALLATKTTLDKYGEEHIETDHDKRLKAAVMGLELEGYIRSKVGSIDQSKHTHVTYSWQPVQVINTNSIDGGVPRVNVD